MAEGQRDVNTTLGYFGQVEDPQEDAHTLGHHILAVDQLVVQLDASNCSGYSLKEVERQASSTAATKSLSTLEGELRALKTHWLVVGCDKSDHRYLETCLEHSKTTDVKFLI